MYQGAFVIDAVAHAFDFRPSNYAYPRYAEPIVDSVAMINEFLAPAGYRIPRDQMVRDWGVEETAGMLFHESSTDMAVFHPTPVYSFKDGMSGPHKAAEIVERYPNRFLGAYIAVDPLPGVAAAIDEIKKQSDRLGDKALGLKLYPTSWHNGQIRSWHMNDPKVAFPIIEAAAELGIKHIAVHKAVPLGPTPGMEAFNPDDMDIVADEYREMTFEVVHGGLAFTQETAWLLSRFDNVYINFESVNMLTVTHPAAFKRVMGELLSVGGEAVIDRLVWATGAMQFHPQPTIEALWDFEFGEEERAKYGLLTPVPELTHVHKRKILGENYARLLGTTVADLAAGLKDDEFTRPENAPLREPFSETASAGSVLVHGSPAGGIG